MPSLYFILGIQPDGLNTVKNVQRNRPRRSNKPENHVHENLDNTQTVMTMDNNNTKHPFEANLSSNERKLDLPVIKLEGTNDS